MDLSPLVALPDAVNGPSASQSLKLLTLQTPGAVVQEVPMPNASNISLQGLTAQQLNEWLDSLNTPRNASKDEEQINHVRLATEITKLGEETMGVNRLESYTEEELRHLCPRITREVGKIHQKSADLIDKHDIEIEKTKHLKRSYRLDFEAKDFEDSRNEGASIELLQSAKIWGALEKFEGRWENKKDKRKRDSQEGSEGVQKEKDPVKILPMQEIPGGGFVHVPWHRNDILSFTNDFPKLREKQVEWFMEGLRPEIGQMIRSHLICWQVKPIDEILQCAKYSSDEIELKQKKLKEKAMVMQIKAAQTGVQGALV
ncbi:hypothetical protein NDU88_007651 [Pleurodeles waltl]|uniref:Uncharacterized protein n=1 Tax=Pleurodeles waltl TaxID=8319 RepID=A0AAV7NTN7_PLEWA|nr:hypothetical protein NDU88_007651 [Pleurodeles waltl]